MAWGQVATEKKSNEIRAIPQLLQQMELKDALVAMDAMGCQKDIARANVTGGGDFVIAIKNNQPKLHDGIRNYFEDHLNCDLEDLQYRCHETTDEGHGRTDERSYYLTKVPSDFPLKKDWPWVKAIGYSLRVTEHSDGRETYEVRY